MQQAPAQLSHQLFPPLRSSTAPTVVHKKGQITDIGIRRLRCLKSLPCCEPKLHIICLYMGACPILLKYNVSIQIWPLLLDCWNHMINKHLLIHRPCHSYWFCFDCSSWSVPTIPLCCPCLNTWPHPNLPIKRALVVIVILPRSCNCCQDYYLYHITLFCETRSGTGSFGAR
jgi:hypothetical protein